MANEILVGIDTGGTFTDFVLFDGESLSVHKVLSTPNAPEQAILAGLADLGLSDQVTRLIHGSTVATNAVLEHKGVRTAFITNKGLRDILIIGRQARRELYNLTPKPRPPLVDRELCIEVDTRLAANGSLLKDLSQQQIQRMISKLRQLQPRSVAISLLFSFLDNRQELAIKRAIEENLPNLFVSVSAEVLPEYKEYERGSTTWLNAYVGPLVQGYLQRMETQLPKAQIAIMQSSGITCDVTRAGGEAVNLLLSGPAGGLEGARFVGDLSGRQRLMTLDMGGTSTDVALIDGQISLTSEGKIGDHPVSVPMVDIHTIGAGGGSIAWVDAGGLLQVGPQSAGAAPGPVCYGQGGKQVTVTDANLILGRLPSSTRLGNNLPLNLFLACQAMQKLTEQLGLSSIEETAAGVIEIANEHMAGALRVISVQKGYNPKDFVLMSFGGAGGLHVCELAERLKMDSAMIPVHAGVLSALGMLAARPGRQLSRTLAQLLSNIDSNDLLLEFESLIEEGLAAMVKEGHSVSGLVITQSLDLCYAGQSFTLNIPWQENPKLVAQAFHKAHELRYGHRLQVDIELVNLRVSITGKASQLILPELNLKPLAPLQRSKIHGIEDKVGVWWRKDLAQGQRLNGPAIISEAIATTFIAPGWNCQVDKIGNLLINKSDSEP